MSKAHKCEVCEELYEGQSRKKRNFNVNVSQFKRRSSDIGTVSIDIIWNYTDTPEFKGKGADKVDMCEECFDHVILRIAKALLHPLDPDSISDADLSRRIRVENENGND